VALLRILLAAWLAVFFSTSVPTPDSVRGLELGVHAPRVVATAADPQGAASCVPRADLGAPSELHVPAARPPAMAVRPEGRHAAVVLPHRFRARRGEPDPG